jgi:hypothetical protein
MLIYLHLHLVKTAMAIMIPQLLLVILRNSLFLLCMKGINET